MSCNCNSGDTPEYYITLDGVGADGYSPEINVTQEDTASFRLNLINKDNEQLTPIIPKLSYLNDNFVTNSAFSATLANYSTTAQIAVTYLSMSDAATIYLSKTDAVDTYLSKADAATSYLKVDGSNANNPVTINNLSIQSIGTGTRIGSSGGALTLQGSGVRPAYLQTGSTSKSLALLSDVPTVTNKLETDGSNATSNIAINGITFRNQSNYNNIIKAKDGLNLELSNGGSILDNNRATISLDTNGNARVSGDNNVNLSAVNDIHLNTTNGKVYYGATTDASKEIATIGDVPTVSNATITLTQGGVTKGSFTLNQSGSATIALDSGGSTIGNQISLITEDSAKSLTLGVDNTTKRVIANYNTLSEGAVSSSIPINLIKSVTAPITVSASSVDGLCDIGLDYDTNSLDVDANNKLVVDSDYIEAHKAYLADGDTLTDPQGLQDVKYYNYSDFDKNKFTKVGSPIVTDDGIASGFVSSTNFLNATYTLTTPTTSIDIWTKVIITNTTETSGIYWAVDGNLRLQRSSASAIGLRGFSGTLSCDVTGLSLALNDEVIIHANVTGTNATVDVWINGVKSSNSVTHSNTIESAYSHLVVGGQYRNGNYSPKNSIDLKYQRVLFDGVPVFSGNKTGVDTIKPDDYTVVGTPTISADGILNLDGTNNRTNYIKKSISLFSSNNPFKLYLPIKITELPTTAYAILYLGSGIQINIETTGQVKCLIRSGTAQSPYWDIINTELIPASIVNQKQELVGVIEWTGAEYILGYIKNGVYTNVNTTTSAVKPYSTTGINIGMNQVNSPAFTGSIDLNSFKIYVDGNLVYQPCLKIPYTKSKTGSKIADVSVRPRVTDMYEQFGYSPYYTLDEANGNFTLPMGEIYGYITRLEGIVKDLQTRLAALESNINGGGAGVVQQGLLGMSPLSLGRPQLLGDFNPEDEMDTMDIEPVEDEITPVTISENELKGEITQEEVELQPVENELPQEEIELEPQETEEETDEGGENE